VEFNDFIMSTGVVRSIVVMLVGIMFMFWSESVANMFIRALGVAFFLPAFVSIVRLYVSNVQQGTLSKLLVSTVDVGSMAFGLWLIILPAGFETMVVKLLAVIALIFALFQIFMVFAARRSFALSAWTLLVPALLLVGGVLLFTSSFRPLKALSVMFGIVAVLSGIFDLVISLKLGRANRDSDADTVLLN
jgi:uncharacterized membrane protein HdeD (DUF308 family)